jgi:catechol 2,3-dioxygenase-like lactoylglutathione lyase family enzyme
MHLNHLHISVRDVARTRQFYENYLGFRFFRAIEEDFIFLRDDYGLLLAIDKIDQPASFPNWFHYGFCLDSRDAVKAAYERMKADSIPLGMELKEFDSRVVFFCLDPDGNKIEIFWEDVEFGKAHEEPTRTHEQKAGRQNHG